MALSLILSRVENGRGSFRFSVAYGSPFALSPQSDLPLLRFPSPQYVVAIVSARNVKTSSVYLQNRAAWNIQHFIKKSTLNL
jgi:hypothetical protein